MSIELLIATSILIPLLIPLLVVAGHNICSARKEQTADDGLPIHDANVPEWARDARTVTTSANSIARREAEYGQQVDSSQSVGVDVPGAAPMEYNLPSDLSPPDFQSIHRDGRIERDKRREMVRYVLQGVSRWNYYVFDHLMTTDAGIIDYVAIGPAKIYAIVVRDDPGAVTTLPDRTILIDGKPLTDDPRHQAADIAQDLLTRLPNADEVSLLICFTQAEFYLGPPTNENRGLCNVWGLSENFDPAVNDESLNTAEIEELAELVEQIYERPPFVTPDQEGTY